MERGYFALWRKFQDHQFWKEKRVFSKAEAWIDILWEAQHNEKPQKVILGRERMVCLTCNYGESLKSLRTWAKRWGWTKDRVQRFLKLLKNMAQIETVDETVTTRIKVLNYKEYDPRHIKTRQQARQERDSNETGARQDKKGKKGKNNIYSEVCEETIAFLNKTSGMKYTSSNGNCKYISARYKEGFTLEDFKKVIITKWKDPEFNKKYYRPSTLFNSEKFEGYLNESQQKSQSNYPTPYKDDVPVNPNAKEKIHEIAEKLAGRLSA